MKLVKPNVRKAAKVRAEEIILGQFLRACREENQMSQAAIAEAMGLKQPAIARMETQKDMKLSTLQAFAKSVGGELIINIRRQGAVYELVAGKKRAVV